MDGEITIEVLHVIEFEGVTLYYDPIRDEYRKKPCGTPQ